MDGRDDSQRVTVFLTIAFASIALLALLAIGTAHGAGWWAASGIALAVLLASFLVGTLLGFLFSVPRVLARGIGSGGGEGVAPGGGRQLLQTNSNLERISDWLTTLLVGVGLSQLHRVNEGLAGFSVFVAGAIPAEGRADSVLPGLAPFILLIGLVLGFLAMYLYTRIEISRLFGEVEDVLDRSVQRALAGTQRASGLGGAAPDAKTAPGTGPVPPAAIFTPTSPSTDQPRTVDDALDLMFGLLYQPDGYQRVVSTAASLI